MNKKPRFGFVVEYVKDVEAAKRFYVEVLGLEVERYHPTSVQFDRFAIAGDKPMEGDDRPELYWLVDDAEAAFADLSRKARSAFRLSRSLLAKYSALRISTVGLVTCLS
jgi:catechol 2,3-dioxygenase-like lactoylglutathione lyase family enzyme